VLAESRAIIDSPLSWQPLSYSPLSSMAWWTFLLSLVMFFFVFRKCCAARSTLRFFIWIMLGVATIEALYGLIQALIPTVGALWVDYIGTGNARGTFINRNHFAGFMEMIWPLGLGFTLAQGNWNKEIRFRNLLGSERPYQQFLLSLVIVIMLLALLFSKSRSGITGAFIGFMTFVILMRTGKRRLPASFWVIIGAIVVLMVYYSFQIGVDPVIERFLKISGDNPRLDRWRDSLVILKDHPLGIGLGTFKQVYPVYKVSTVSETQAVYTHNDYLQLLVEAGWIGFIALVSGFVIFMMKSIRKVKKLHIPDDPLRFFLAGGALSGLVSMAFHSFFDFNLQIPANCVYFVTLIAIVHICLWSTDLKNRSADYANFRRLNS
jgi:O-antigen ligase